MIKNARTSWEYEFSKKSGKLRIENSDERFIEFDELGKLKTGELYVNWDEGKIGFGFTGTDSISVVIGFSNLEDLDVNGINFLGNEEECVKCENLGLEDGELKFRVQRAGEYSL